MLNKNSMQTKTLQNLFEKYHGINCGIISAYQNDKTKKENPENSGFLRAILVGGLFSVTTISGYYKNAEKDFFLVFDYKNKGNLREVLTKLADKFDQETAVYNDVSAHECHILGTSTIINKNLYSPENQGIISELEQYTFNQEVSEIYHYFDDTILKYVVWHKQVLDREYHKIFG